MHKQAINHKQAIIGGGYLFTENACFIQTYKALFKYHIVHVASFLWLDPICEIGNLKIKITLGLQCCSIDILKLNMIQHFENLNGVKTDFFHLSITAFRHKNNALKRNVIIKSYFNNSYNLTEIEFNITFNRPRQQLSHRKSTHFLYKCVTMFRLIIRHFMVFIEGLAFV